MAPHSSHGHRAVTSDSVAWWLPSVKRLGTESETPNAGSFPARGVDWLADNLGHDNRDSAQSASS